MHLEPLIQHMQFSRLDCIFNENGLAIPCILDEYKRKMTMQVHPHECAIKMNLDQDDCIFNDNGLAIHCILDEYKWKMTMQVHPHECTIKMNLEEPAFITNPPVGLLLVFLPNMVFNGATYTGEVGKNKRDAEQLAARAAILSIMASFVTSCLPTSFRACSCEHQFCKTLRRADLKEMELPDIFKKLAIANDLQQVTLTTKGRAWKVEYIDGYLKDDGWSSFEDG